MDDVRDLVDKKRTLLQTLGYQVVEMWEYSWNVHKDSNQELAEYLAHRDLKAPLEPREAFYGDRSNAIRLYAQVKKEDREEIRYDDYTSLYPWVNKRIPRRTCYLPLRTRHHGSLTLFRVRPCCLTVVMAS